jgi:hypothetical protein
MAGRILAIDKCPGIQRIGIGETWRRAIAKCVLHVAGKGAKESCGINQLCAGLKSGIEGAIHAMQHMWERHKAEQEWGFLLIDAKNAFNEQSRTAMLWTVRHQWPSGARFTFNYYKHWGTLVIRNNNGTGAFIYSKEGVTQGDPLSMFVMASDYYLSFVRNLFQQRRRLGTWMMRVQAASSTLLINNLQSYKKSDTKSILIVSHDNLPVATAAFKDSAFTITTSNRYLGGFIGG